MRTVRTVGVALVLTLAVGLAACSSDSSSGSEGASKVTTTAPEQGRTSPAKVAAGLGKINVTAAAITAAAAVDKDKAVSLADKIEPDWQPIEGTVKANDPDSYLAFEDAFAVIEKAAADGDAKQAASATEDIAKASAAYLKDYPA